MADQDDATTVRARAQQGQETILNGRYRLERWVGGGGFGDVYLASDLSLGRRAAVKVLKLARAVDREFRDRFRLEGRTIAALDHPHILPVHDLGEANNLVYLVMPFVEGGTLADLLRRDGPLDVARALVYVRQAAAALDYAYERHRLIHRDVKPANMLVRDGEHLLLADFGLAAMVAADRTHVSTEASGSLPYMSPEQLRGQVRRETDVYALGCVLFELLVGRTPYIGTPKQVMHGHLWDPVPSVEARSTGRVSGTLQPVIERVLAKDHRARYRAAGELAASVEAVITTRAARTGSGVAPPPVEIARLLRCQAAQLVPERQDLPKDNWSLAWAPDGRRIVAISRAGWSKKLLLWDGGGTFLGAMERPRTELTGLQGVSHRMCPLWSPDSSILAAITKRPDTMAVKYFVDHYSVAMWDADGHLRGEAEWLSGYVYGVAWAPDATTLAVAHGAPILVSDPSLGNYPGEAKAIDNTRIGRVTLLGRRGERVSFFEYDRVGPIAYAPDGEALALSSADGGLAIYTPEGQLLRRLPGGHVGSELVWSPAGGALVARALRRAQDNGDKNPLNRVSYRLNADLQGQAWLWSDNPAEHAVQLGAGMEAAAISWSPDGALLALTYTDGRVDIWEVGEKRMVASVAGTTAAWSSDGTVLATVIDRSVRLWRRDGKRLGILAGVDEPLQMVAWSPVASVLAAAGPTGVWLWQ